MKAFNNYDEAKKSADAAGAAKLPVGAYVCKIKQVRYENGDKGDRIVLAFDVFEGEFKDFFANQFEANTNEDKKWKGRVNIFVPKDDGTDLDAITKRSFAGWVSAIEKSNPGYLWDWDEQKWADKLVGIVFGNTGTIIEGKEVVYTEARFAVEVQKVRDGNAPVAKFKTKNGYTGNGNGGNGESNDDFLKIPTAGKREELPF